MTFQRFLDWLYFSETVIEDLYIYEQTDYFAYTEYTGTFDAILVKRGCNRGFKDMSQSYDCNSVYKMKGENEIAR